MVEYCLMTDPENLRQFYPFDEDILQRVESAATRQDNQTYKSLAASYGAGHGPVYSEMYDDNEGGRERAHRRVSLQRLHTQGRPSETDVTRILFAPFALPPD